MLCLLADLAAYERLFLTTLLALPGVAKTRSHIAIRAVKESGPLQLRSH